MDKPTFFTDTHINFRAIKQLRERGVSIIRCQDVGLQDENDENLLTYAAENNFIMVSCDNDFEVLHYAWLAASKFHAGIVLFDQHKHCDKIGVLVNEIFEVFEAAENENDLHNELWRVKL